MDQERFTGGELAESTIGRVWDKARMEALSEDEYRSPLAKRPYDLRHLRRVPRRSWSRKPSWRTDRRSIDGESAGALAVNRVGRGVIDGVECEHLAFRNQDVDWQLWVQVGTKPIPCKYVITSKAVGMAPQYTLVIRDWKTDVPVDQTAFTFKPAEGATKVEPNALASLDELPPSVPAKGQ